MRLYEPLLAALLLLTPVLGQSDDDPPPPDTTSDPDPDDPPVPTPTGVDAFANVTIYQPDDGSHQVTFPRTENLPNKTVLAAWNEPAVANGAVAVYRSTDSGFSWYSIGSVASKTRGRTIQQPHILFINGTGNENDDGQIDVGTVLMAVNAVDAKSTNIEVYASSDLGETWDLASQVTSGGPVVDTNGTAVAHPFLVLNGNRVTLYYSRQDKSVHASKLIQQSTSDYWGTWGSAIDVVASQAASDKLGIPTVAKLPNNQYILTYTQSLLDAATKTYTDSIYYKVASSPENFGAAMTQEIKTDSGRAPQGASFVTWSSLGGSNGTVVLSDSKTSSLFINEGLGQGKWTEFPTTAGRAEGREVRVPNNDASKLRIATGSELGQKSSSQIMLTVVDFAKWFGG